jgi:cytoskeletal protein RodZ
MHVDRSMQDKLVETSVMREPTDAKKVSWKVLITISIASLGVAGLAQILVTNNSTPDIPVAVDESATPSPSSDATTEPTDEPAISTGEGVEVIITATRAKSWLFVSDANGRTLFSGQISQGVTKTFTTGQQLNMKVGNAGGVDLSVNGKNVDPLGIDGQVVSVSYGVDS